MHNSRVIKMPVPGIAILASYVKEMPDIRHDVGALQIWMRSLGLLL